ncbi:hypothetical protein LZ496_13655 [Sphingomonas sp. NSE70-1]|uniref:Uncharacterized protein n=1 Tax=Sphingomonas caseinilyticus TaxID=2908205 RepID=A0ABT0RXY7_9SPHN|nr:hypothetical protein [Sphingomonas caseinilyticus]MCL6699821.1 hypothetical protein [Sphingomonas caseinilyticus]
MDERVARLRQQADHCRELALGLNDERTISTLLAMAQEYDEKAEEVENYRPKPRRLRQPGP